MSALARTFVSVVGKKLVFPNLARSITLAPVYRFKEIIEKKEGNTLTIEGRIVPDPDESRLFKPEGTKACPLCSLGLNVKHTDVLILSQFLTPDGCVIPMRITRLCSVQQRRVQKMVAMAQKAGLMPNLNPKWSHKDPKRRYGWKKYNHYFDEETIRQKYKHTTLREHSKP